MKYEWRKQDKLIYLPKAVPTVIEVPKMNYLTIDGAGNPNSTEFSKLVEALYAYSYAIKLSPKKAMEPEGYFDYTVFPLEGFWTATVPPKVGEAIDKDTLIYQLMIRQPEFVTEQVVDEFKELVAKKVPLEQLMKVKFMEIDEGKNLQMLHIGSYDSEAASFKKMEEHCIANDWIPSRTKHKEIYLSDPRKVLPEKQKTVLRFQIRD
ncbi:GyrI-like domain-containing protein [Carnobacterium gallinarum]|uniref:GyrI-like domain-containing protein n=1 Tax=Carnobacterium gallinarum TaxID=2749 RepID=UPI000553C9FB|nr:GyrI-like domain-containing protein [Carnobacterium gallinarum]